MLPALLRLPSREEVLPISLPTKSSQKSWFSAVHSEVRAPLQATQRHTAQPSTLHATKAQQRKIATPSRPPPPLPPPPPPLPPPPRLPPSTTIRLHKPRGATLGVRFYSSRRSEAPGEGEAGAEVQSVEPYGLAWRSGLAWGDVITGVRVHSSRAKQELLAAVDITSGYDAAKALRPAIGYLELSVRKRLQNDRDRAAVCLQAACLGMLTRAAAHNASNAATHIAGAWRRWCARQALRARRAQRRSKLLQRTRTLRGPVAHAAALQLQCAWRRYVGMLAAWERTLALQHIQKLMRAWLMRQRAMVPRLSRKRRRGIRAPPCLILDEDADDAEPSD